MRVKPIRELTGPELEEAWVNYEKSGDRLSPDMWPHGIALMAEMQRRSDLRMLLALDRVVVVPRRIEDRLPGFSSRALDSGQRQPRGLGRLTDPAGQ